MFRIKFFTPQVTNAEGWQHAGAELILGDARMCFLVDLTYWSIADYYGQWQRGIARLTRGAPSTALMIAYRGPHDSAHTMWALWRDDAHVYVQGHSVLPAEIDGPFDPNEPYEHIGARVPAAESGLPIPEWCVPVEQLHAAMLGIHWPKYFG